MIIVPPGTKKVTLREDVVRGRYTAILNLLDKGRLNLFVEILSLELFDDLRTYLASGEAPEVHQAHFGVLKSWKDVMDFVSISLIMIATDVYMDQHSYKGCPPLSRTADCEEASRLYHKRARELKVDKRLEDLRWKAKIASPKNAKRYNRFVA